MITPELADYIKGELERGVSKEDLKSVLISTGWQAADADAALGLTPAAAEPTPEMDLAAVLSMKAEQKKSFAARIEELKQKLSPLLQKFSKLKSKSVSNDSAVIQIPVAGSATMASMAPSLTSAQGSFKERLMASVQQIPHWKVVLPAVGMLLVAGAAGLGYLNMRAEMEMAPPVRAVPVSDDQIARMAAAEEKRAKAEAKADAEKKPAEPAVAKKSGKPAEPVEESMEDAEGIKIAKGNPNLDTDGDGLDDEMENMLGCNPRKRDSDGDGVNDGAEVKRGEDPTSAE